MPSLIHSPVPAQEVTIDAIHAGVYGQPEQADGDHAGNNLVRPHELTSLQNAKTEAVIDGDHLCHDDDDERHPDADAKAGQYVGGGGGQDDPQKKSRSTCSQIAGLWIKTRSRKTFCFENGR